MKTIALCNLGCSKNIVDGENIAGFFESSGYRLVEEYAEAEVIIVNTCAFIREATQEAIDSILDVARFKTEGACKTLVVAGCFSQRYRDTVAARFPEVDLWAGVDDWPQKLQERFSLNTPSSPFARSLSGLPGTQYLKIAEGCSHRCTYCVIPAIRGDFVSRSIAEIRAEAQWLSGQGIRECILVSQDTSYYGRDRGDRLVGLLEDLLRSTPFEWIRLMYLHPQFVDDDLLKLVAAESRICPYFDIPLQHVAEPILTAMKRPSYGMALRALIERIRTICPDAAIRTSFILGFPGETDKQVRELIEFMEWARFEKVGVFPFSPEEGTPAATLRPRPKIQTVQRRCEEVMLVQREISREVCARRIGRTVPVMIDRVSDDPLYRYEGRTRWDAPEVDGHVFVSHGDHMPGSISLLNITAATDYDLIS